MDHDIFCVCNHEGVDIKTMLQCKGCKLWWHPHHLYSGQKLAAISQLLTTKKHKWLCKDSCAFKRDEKFRKESQSFMRKYENLEE